MVEVQYSQLTETSWKKEYLKRIHNYKIKIKLKFPFNVNFPFANIFSIFISVFALCYSSHFHLSFCENGRKIEVRKNNKISIFKYYHFVFGSFNFSNSNKEKYSEKSEERRTKNQRWNRKWGDENHKIGKLCFSRTRNRIQVKVKKVHTHVRCTPGEKKFPILAQTTMWWCRTCIGFPFFVFTLDTHPSSYTRYFN